jgi:hypothetical protein
MMLCTLRWRDFLADLKISPWNFLKLETQTRLSNYRSIKLFIPLHHLPNTNLVTGCCQQSNSKYERYDDPVWTIWWWNIVELQANTLQLQLGTSPVTSLGVVSDLVAGAHSDPLRDGTILLQLLGELKLDSECLVWRHCVS